MVQKQGQIITNFNSTPVRRVYPSSQQSPLRDAPHLRSDSVCGSEIGCVSLFGGGEDAVTYAKGKLEQFEAQYAKISAAHEEHTVEKLKALLKEASDVIQEQMTIIRTFTEADNCNVPLSFLGDNGFLFALSVSRR